VNTQTWSKHVIVVRLPPEPRTGDELETVTQIALNEPDFDVVMDFADVPTMSYPALVGLMILYRTLGETGRRLAFCNTAAVREVFQAHRISSALAGNCEEGVILEPPADSQSSGTLVLGRQNRAGMCERRRYVRLNVSRSLKRRVQV
jgi:anti-anti-sigma regulatory factor